VQIFEVCNFQDLTGQRVSKAVTTLRFIEEHIDRMLQIWQKVEQFKPVVPDDRAEDNDQRFLNGPKLSGDGGHSTQSEIDKMFVG
jgi:chemotaxis protein CheZ